MGESSIRILLIDDDKSSYIITRELLAEISGERFELEWVETYADGLAAIERGAHDVYLVDHRLGPHDGLKLLREANAKAARAPIIMLTGQEDHDIDVQAMKAGAADYLVKDAFDVSRLEHSIRYALERQGLLNDLNRERELLHSLMDNLPDSIYFKDAQSRFLRISKALALRFGLDDPADAEGKTDSDFFTHEHAQQALQDELELMQTGQPVLDKEEKETWPDGRTTWANTSKLPLRDKHGNLIGTFGVSRDITKRKAAEQALRHSEQRTRLIVDTALDAFVAMDDKGMIIDWNPEASKTFGWSREEILGRSLAESIIPEQYRAAHRAGLEQFTRTGTGNLLNRRIEITALHRDGHEFPIEMTISPIRLGDSYLFSAFIHDITQRKQAEAALREAKDAAESANQAKSDFLANMSHEIRTPLNAIIGMTELLLDSQPLPAQIDYLQMVRASGDSLLLLINDILDFSKIEAGRLDLSHNIFDARESLGDTMKSLALRAHREDLELAYHIARDVPARLLGDVGRLRQIVVNLVGNAIKFTEQGEVVLDVEIESRVDGEVELHFSVADMGIGIADDKLSVIFDEFEQADSSTTRRFGGTGLGLAISSRLVDAMHGRIWVESKLGHGSTFHFTARFQLPDADQAAAFDRQPELIQGTSVLVVDDNATNRRILAEMLTNWEMEPTCAASVAEAVDLLRNAQRAGRAFRLVLSDVNMPDVDGFALAEAIRNDRTLADTVIMMLTSGNRLEHVARCAELDTAAHLTKPIKQSELFDAIVVALGVEVVEDDTKSQPAGDTEPSPGPLRILLAEDSLANQKLAVGLLEKWGHSVRVAGNGRDAVDAADSERFDLVLMDIQMPEMDGLEATRVIRERERETETHVPIIAMTAHAMRGDRERCLDAGMDDYVAKPVRATELHDAISGALSKADAASIHNGGSNPNQNDDSDRGRDEESLDWNIALAAVQHDRELLKDVIEAFLEESPGLMTDARQAIDADDADGLARAAHTIKAAFHLFGADKAYRVSIRLEEIAKQNHLDDANELFARLRREIDDIGEKFAAFVSSGIGPDIPSE